MENKYILQLKDLIDSRNTALVGRQNGENLLKLCKSKGIIFKNLEAKYPKIQIVIPSNIITMNKSYFLGFFETRIQEIGKEAFIQKYDFKTNPHILKHIYNEFIDAALLVASQRDILYA